MTNIGRNRWKDRGWQVQLDARAFSDNWVCARQDLHRQWGRHLLLPMLLILVNDVSMMLAFISSGSFDVYFSIFVYIFFFRIFPKSVLKIWGRAWRSCHRCALLMIIRIIEWNTGSWWMCVSERTYQGQLSFSYFFQEETLKYVSWALHIFGGNNFFICFGRFVRNLSTTHTPTLSGQIKLSAISRERSHVYILISTLHML